jgi:hypothetical protein
VYVQRNGLANTRLKCSMKFTSLLRRSATEGNDPRRITFRMITPNTTSIWFSHERVRSQKAVMRKGLPVKVFHQAKAEQR